MYFKNKVTGLAWRITDKSHQRRLQVDIGYVMVSDANTSETPTESHIGSAVSPNVKGNDFKFIEWQELRKLATENGINTHGKKRVEIEKELGDINVTDTEQD